MGTALGLACSESSPTPTAAADIHVVAFAPDATVLDSREMVQIKFDKPAVAEAEVGKTLTKIPVSFSPRMNVTGHWLDRQTLVLKPTENYRSATRYKVTLVSPLSSRVTKKEHTHAFVHEPLTLKGIVGMDTTAAPQDPRFSLEFNLPVKRDDVLGACALHREKNNDRILLTSTGGKSVDTQIPLLPKHPLMQGEKYVVRCQSLQPAEGNWPLEKAERHMKTHPAFGIEKALPKEKVISPDAGKLVIEFATPVARDAFETYVSVVLNGKKVSNRHWDRSGQGRVYKWNSYLEAVSKYEIGIRRGLADKFGQTLEKNRWIKFETTDAPPAISAETGITVVEAKMDGYQVWTRNVASMAIECAKVPAGRIAALMGSGELELYPWIGGGRENIDWDALKLKPKKETLQIDRLKNRWKEHRIAVSDICGKGEDGGIYLTQLTSDEVRREKEKNSWGRYPFRALANVTDLGVTLKVGPASGMVWVASMSTGQTVPGAQVTVYDLSGKRLFKGTTDNNGMLQVPGSAALNKKQGQASNDEYDEYYQVQRFITVVEKGSDVAFVDGDWNEGITLWNFSVKSDRSGGKKRIRGFIQSDRGIYRPGETVFFKALVREVSFASMPKTPKERAEVIIEDPYGTELFNKRMSLSRFGSLAFKLNLSTQARLGDYYVKISVAGQTFRERFSVEEFRPVSFEIKKTSDGGEQLMGQALKYAFQADYLFGAPVKNAKVEWVVTRCQRPLEFKGYERYSFLGNPSYYWSWYDYDENSNNCVYVSDNTISTDSKGRFEFTVSDSGDSDAVMADYIARVTVTDETDQSVTKQVAIRAHSMDVYLGVQPSNWVQRLNDTISVDAVALDTQGKPVAHKAKVKVSYQTWECGDGPGYRYRCESHQTDVLEKDVNIAKEGSRVVLPLKKAGDYIVTLSGEDSRGKKVESSTWVWVSGQARSDWWGDDANCMTLIPSKKSYQPGETAILIPKGDTEGSTLLVTVERDGILSSFVRAGIPSGEGIEVPIEASYAPNVYVSVVALKPRTGETDRARPVFSMGIIELGVSTRKSEIDVKVETEKDAYEPGDTVRGKIVLTSDGRPLVGEVAVSVADEGVLQLINYKTPNPLNTIYAPFGLGIDTSTNLIHLARYISPVDETEEGADGGDSEDAPVRSKFVASAFWKPDLVTDETGTATFEFTAPDNLTAFRVMAVAADAADKFGASDKRIVINKTLLLNPVLPRFFGSGDRAWIGAVVHNYADVAGEVKVNWALEGLWTKGTGDTITLQSGESRRVQFYVQAGKQKQAKVKISAQMQSEKGAFADAFEITVPVRRKLSVSRESLFEGKTTDSGDIPIAWPDDVVTSFSEVSVTVDRYGLGAIGESLRYLVQYPYGCLEQTMSRLVPMFKVKDLATSLNMDELKGGKLKEYIAFGVDKVLRHQHDDGQFSLWPDSTPSPHLTAFALWGLSEARKAGVPVDDKAVERGVSALGHWAADKAVPGSIGEAAELAQVAFVLAHYGRPDNGLNARLYEQRNMLPVYGKAQLLRAMVAAKESDEFQQQLVSEILGAATRVEGSLFIKESTSPAYHSSLVHFMSSDVRSTAMVITALTEYNASLTELPMLIDGLKSQRVNGGRWHNTQENVYGLIAIADYVRAQEAGDAAPTITLNGKPWKSFELRGSQVMRFKRTLRKLTPGAVRVTSDTPVVVSIQLALAREKTNPPKVDNGFSVTRAYTDLKTGNAVEKVKAGTIVKVRLEVQSVIDRDYVAVSDALPAGFEAVNTRLAVVDSTLSQQTGSNYVWDYVELRDDHVNAFANFMRAGTKSIEYLMRA
ncbi:MAG: hypothetical protein JXX14_26610, partial [Deltaproteobacteria bacterium]|nr:hypothetical protein [Deltaproteobacteria bacterium]